MSSKYDIIVVGGGLVGLAFTLDMAVRNSGLKLLILEKKTIVELKKGSLDTRIYAISPTNISYLQGLGIHLDHTMVGVIDKMEVVGDCGGSIILDKKESYNQYLAQVVAYNYLQQMLINKIGRYDNIEIRYDNLIEISYLGNNKVKLQGEDNIYESTLVVGSDGSESFVRRSFGIQVNRYDYLQYGIVANFECERYHNNVAHQWFNNGRILAYLPLFGNFISIVYSCRQHHELMNLSSCDFEECIAKNGNYKLGKLSLIESPAAFSLSLCFVDKLWQPNMALIGDAAHTIHPLAGQGVNIGFEDARVLAQLLSKIKSHQLGDSATLSYYSANRIFKIKKMQYICHALHGLFGVENILVRDIRNHGLNLAGKSVLLKRFLIANAV